MSNSKININNKDKIIFIMNKTNIKITIILLNNSLKYTETK